MSSATEPTPADGRLSTSVAFDTASRELEALGLSQSAARLLLALLRAGSASSVELARLSRVPRASTYQVLEELESRDLVERLPGESPAVWTSVAPAELLDRLRAAEDDRHTEQRERTQALGPVLARLFPNAGGAPASRMRLIRSAAQAKRASNALFDETREEVLFFSRPPYLNPPSRPLRHVVDLVARGVAARSLNRMVDLEDPEAHSFRSDILDYARAGMEVRLVDDLPIKLVVFDRATVLVAILDDHVSSYPDLLLVEDRGFAQVMAAIFEQWWAGARVLSTTMPESGCR